MSFCYSASSSLRSVEVVLSVTSLVGPHVMDPSTCPCKLESSMYRMQRNCCALAALYYAGAYYLGELRGQHTWHNFAASGAVTGAASALWMLRPFRVRPVMFASALGAALGSSGAFAVSMLGQPYWEEGHDFEGYFFGSKLNFKEKPKKAEEEVQG